LTSIGMPDSQPSSTWGLSCAISARFNPHNGIGGTGRPAIGMRAKRLCRQAS
jgi:hypothetical protein